MVYSSVSSLSQIVINLKIIRNAVSKLTVIIFVSEPCLIGAGTNYTEKFKERFKERTYTCTNTVFDMSRVWYKNLTAEGQIFGNLFIALAYASCKHSVSVCRFKLLCCLLMKNIPDIRRLL